MATGKRASKKVTPPPEQPDMYKGSERNQVTAANSWWLVTNHQNAVRMLASGMVCGPRGFGGKYYEDSLAVVPGAAPLFCRGVPASVVDQATSEARHLHVCVMTFALGAFSGNARLFAADGTRRNVILPPTVDDKDAAILLPLPFPVTALTEVRFRDESGKTAFVNAAANLGNVDVSHVPLEVAPAAFEPPTCHFAWPPEEGTDDVVDTVPALGQAIGGMLAILSRAANRNDTALACYHAMVLGEGVSEFDRRILITDPILRWFPDWLRTHQPPRDGDILAQLYWGTVNAIIQAKRTGSPLKPLDEALKFLEAQLAQLDDAKHRKRLETLIADMRMTIGFADNTISELLSRHRGSLSRSLLLFCLRSAANELLAFAHRDLGDAEYTLACILFGARDGWFDLPQPFKESSALHAYAAWMMATTEQSVRGGGLAFAKPSLPPPPIRELFLHSGEGWGSAQRDAALELARSEKWNDCLRTRIDLPKGEYRLDIGSSMVSVWLNGDVKTVVTEVDEGKFMARIGTNSISAKSEKTVRKVIPQSE